MTNPTMAHRQATRFLELLNAMNAEAQRAFRHIYTLAPKGEKQHYSRLSGKHVRVAMMESLNHPQIAYWVRMNLAVRVARKFAQTTGQQKQLERLNHLLEEFHIASDAFVLKLSLEMAQAHRQQRQSQQKGATLPSTGILGAGISDQEFDRIQAFKQTVIPGFIGSIRRKLSA